MGWASKRGLQGGGLETPFSLQGFAKPLQATLEAFVPPEGGFVVQVFVQGVQGCSFRVFRGVQGSGVSGVG